MLLVFSAIRHDLYVPPIIEGGIRIVKALLLQVGVVIIIVAGIIRTNKIRLGFDLELPSMVEPVNHGGILRSSSNWMVIGVKLPHARIHGRPVHQLMALDFFLHRSKAILVCVEPWRQWRFIVLVW